MPERHSAGVGGGGVGVKAFLHLKLAIWASLG